MTTTETERSEKRPMRVRPVPAVTRSIAILRLLGRRKDGMGVKAIADELELVPSTCLHILRVLVSENLVTQDSMTKRYCLGNGMVSLARSVLENAGFSSVVQPMLDALATNWRMTAMGAEITARDSILVLAAARPDSPLQLHANVGSEFFSMTSATGRLVAAFSGLSDDALEARFPKIAWDRPIPCSVWLDEVRQARGQKWSVDHDCFKNGITAYAVPIFSAAGAMTHSIVVMGLTADMQHVDAEKLLAEMAKAASITTRALLDS